MTAREVIEVAENAVSIALLVAAVGLVLVVYLLINATVP
jgi:hypothetical protein